jgi:hypothetical protein
MHCMAAVYFVSLRPLVLGLPGPPYGAAYCLNHIYLLVSCCPLRYSRSLKPMLLALRLGSVSLGPPVLFSPWYRGSRQILS